MTITLPPLPEPYAAAREFGLTNVHTTDALQAHATAAIQEDRAKRSEVVAWSVYVAKHQNGYLIDSLDDPQFVEDATNDGAVAEPLYSSPPDTLDVLRRCIVAMEGVWAVGVTGSNANSLKAAIADARSLLDGGKL